MEELAFISAIAAIVVTIIWIVIGWRAMRAHERIADTASEWMAQQRSDRRAATSKPKPTQPQSKSPLIPQQVPKPKFSQQPTAGTEDKPTT
jgi:hypothetical protein